MRVEGAVLRAGAAYEKEGGFCNSDLALKLIIITGRDQCFWHCLRRDAQSKRRHFAYSFCMGKLFSDFNTIPFNFNAIGFRLSRLEGTT